MQPIYSGEMLYVEPVVHEFPVNDNMFAKLLGGSPIYVERLTSECISTEYRNIVTNLSYLIIGVELIPYSLLTQEKNGKVVSFELHVANEVTTKAKAFVEKVGKIPQEEILIGKGISVRYEKNSEYGNETPLLNCRIQFSSDFESVGLGLNMRESYIRAYLKILDLIGY